MRVQLIVDSSALDVIVCVACVGVERRAILKRARPPDGGEASPENQLAVGLGQHGVDDAVGRRMEARVDGAARPEAGQVGDGI